MARFAFTHFVTTSTSTSTVLHVVTPDGNGTRCGSSASVKADHRVGALLCRKCANEDGGQNLLFPVNYPYLEALHCAIYKFQPRPGEDRLDVDILRQVAIVFAGTHPTDHQIIAEATRRAAGLLDPTRFGRMLHIGYRATS